jgi:hypothetical protein
MEMRLVQYAEGRGGQGFMQYRFNPLAQADFGLFVQFRLSFKKIFRIGASDGLAQLSTILRRLPQIKV